VLAVDEVSLEVREQEIVGIIGANGAGKTTTFDLISGFVPLAGGRIHLGRADVSDATPQQRAAAGLGRSFQDARLFPSMTVRQAIATSLDRRVPVRDPISAAVLSPAVSASERVVAAEVDELIELLHLEAYADKFVGELSTGTRRVVDLAMTLAHRPSVLLLDEPSSGVAQRETESLAPVLLDIRDRTGAALVVIEHDMPLVTNVSDRLVAMELGRVIADGPPEEVIAHPQVVAGYLGGTAALVQRSDLSGATRRRTTKTTARR
jgi:branched-chain amino acid transport system ATP-binding protein